VTERHNGDRSVDERPTVLLVGLGDLGSITLELLARDTSFGRILVASRDEVRGEARCNLARLGAIAQGYAPRIDFVKLDVCNLDMAAHVIDREGPDVIYSTATMQGWRGLHGLPMRLLAPIERAGFGAWAPMELALTYRLMQAVRAAGYRGLTVTAPFPDVVNCALAKVGLAPTAGVGNVAEIVPKLQALAADKLTHIMDRRVSVDDVRVQLTAHHALLHATFNYVRRPNVPPYLLRVELDGENVTDLVHAHDLLLEAFPLTPGAPTHFLTAATTVRLIRALFSSTPEEMHTPSPHGLPGGYPVLVGNGEVHPAPTPGWTLRQAIVTNELSHAFDGVERIEDDGTVVLTERCSDIVQDTLGCDNRRIPLAEAESRGTELVKRFKEYVAHGLAQS
jgi:hypothetical protein